VGTRSLSSGRPEAGPVGFAHPTDLRFDHPHDPERSMDSKVAIPALHQMKRDGQKIPGVVAWDYPIAAPPAAS